MKSNKQINPVKITKSRLPRAMKARARMRQQHRIRSLSAARIK